MGTAKNTGKTTTTAELLNYYHNCGEKIGLTSIGFDGESMDNITGLPKPKLLARKGMVIATAENCLTPSTARIKILEKLDIKTSLGKIICGVVEREGLIVLAGPNQSKHVEKVEKVLHKYGADLVIVDGALNRIVPMDKTQGIVLATGAAFSRDAGKVALWAYYLGEACKRQQALLPLEVKDSRGTVTWNREGKVLARGPASLFVEEQLNALCDKAHETAGIFCPGLVMTGCLDKLLKIPFSPGMTFVFSSPVKLIAGVELPKIYSFINKVINMGGKVEYQKRLPLLAVTVNPFYPEYRHDTSEYSPAYVDKNRLLNEVSEKAGVPVFDVAENGVEELGEIIAAAGDGESIS